MLNKFFRQYDFYEYIFIKDFYEYIFIKIARWSEKRRRHARATYLDVLEQRIVDPDLIAMKHKKSPARMVRGKEARLLLRLVRRRLACAA